MENGFETSSEKPILTSTEASKSFLEKQQVASAGLWRFWGGQAA
jgi:hypothetical protein